MIMSLLDTGSLLMDLDPPLLERAGIEAVEYEDFIAEQSAAHYRRNPGRMWLYSDVKHVAVGAAEALSAMSWVDFEYEARRLLLAGALQVLRQVIPVSAREF